jgi:uncharacterized delta-60 repeat protein
MRHSRNFWVLAALAALAVLATLIFSSTPSPVSAPAAAAAGHTVATRPALTPRPPTAEPLPAPLPATTEAARRALPVSAPLLAWTDRYLAAPDAAARAALLPEGLALARARRPLLAELIRQDPEAALAAALPRALRKLLPVEILADLEQPVSARAELALIQTCFHPPGAAHEPADDLHRATVIDDREYRVHVYGSRLRDGSLPATSLWGISLDRHLAVSDSRHRLLEAGEHPAALPAGSLAVEANGEVTVLASADRLPDFAAALVASEQKSVVNEADSGAGSSTVSGRPSQAWTHGDKDLLVILVDFSDLPGTPVNDFDGDAVINAAYVDEVIHDTEGVRAFLQQGSFGKTDLLFDSATDLTAVLRLPNTAASYATADDSALLHAHARAAATTAGFNVGAYHRVAVVFSHLGNLPGSQFGFGGLANVTGSNLWINGAFDFRVVAHELGHTYGLRHSNLWQVPPGGDPVSLAGSSTEYGDPFDVMGGGDFFENDFSHWNKSLLQWIPDSSVTLASAGGTFRVHRFDASAANLSSPRALKIVRDADRDLWIGYRRGTSSTAADNGAYSLWGYNTASRGNLLDLVTPGAGAHDAPLPLSTTFNDSAAGISVRPVAQGGAGADEWLDIEVTMQPRIQWAATGYVANEQGGSVTLTATRTANFAGTVSVSYATTPGTAGSPADFTAASGNLTWLDGDTAAKTIVVPLVADALVEGTETFTVNLHSPSGGVVVAPATITVTLADPGARDPSFSANFINSTVNRVLVLPDGKLLVAGWFSQLQDAGSDIYNYGRIARLTAVGAVDPEFNPGSGANSTIYALARQPDGKILVGGDFTSFNGTTINRIARLNTDGSLDPTFVPGTGADDTVNHILVQPDGNILVGGSFTSFNGTPRNGLVRLLPGGARDTTFADFTGPVVFSIRALALQTDGRILVGGAFYHQTGNLRASLRRLTSSGAVDATFTGLVQGASNAFNPSFLGAVNQVAVQPDGLILVAGDFSQFNGSARSGLARLTSTGALDATFAPVLNDSAEALLLLPDGRLLVGGNFTTVGGIGATRIARLQSSGALDTAFAAAGGHGASVSDFALQPDGAVVLAGDFGSFQGATPNRPLWRLIPGLSALPGVLEFSTDSRTGIEGTTATLSVTRSGGSLGALTLGYSTVAATASAGVDYTTAAGTLTWADGDASTKTILVPVAADFLADTPETLLVNLGAPLVGGALLGERQQATLTLSTAFAAWQATRFTASELANPAVSGDDADPDGDGLKNLAEFALDRAPRSPDAASAWTTAVQDVGGSDYLTITFRRRSPALDLAYSVQSSSTLAPGSWTADAVQIGSAVSNGDGTETVTYRDSTPSSPASPRRFLRFHVTRTP